MEPGNRQHYRGEAQRSRDDFALVTETEVSPHTVTAPRRSIPQCVSSKVPVKLSSLEGLVSSCRQRGRTGLDRWQLSFVSLCLVTVLLRPMSSFLLPSSRLPRTYLYRMGGCPCRLFMGVSASHSLVLWALLFSGRPTQCLATVMTMSVSSPSVRVGSCFFCNAHGYTTGPWSESLRRD